MRLAFLSIYASAFIISSAYSASLISYLALNTVSLPFSTLEDYVKDGSYRLIVMKYSAEFDVFDVSKISQRSWILIDLCFEFNRAMLNLEETISNETTIYIAAHQRSRVSENA
jgi:hypothetical protein